MNRKVIHRAESRGHANHGWLDTYHTFSFSGYYHPERMHFGALRVLNDDVISGGTGFGTHGHDNMEIVSIPVYGALEHKDSMGNGTVIRENEVQIMSAGSGIKHSEFNHSKDQKTNFLQIWVFPKEKNITPNYDQRQFAPQDRLNRFQTVVEPSGEKGVKIHQDAWFSLADLQAGGELNYSTHLKTNGVYVFVIDGSVEINGEKLNRRDGIGLWEGESVRFVAEKDAQLLVMEIPMQA